jgi:hypothetical protein
VATLQTVVLGNSVNLGAPGNPADVTITIVDNQTAFVVREGANEYINVDTTNTAEQIEILGGPSGDVRIGTRTTSDVWIADDSTNLGFFSSTPIAQPTVAGALSAVTDANARAVLTSIIAAFEAASGLGLIVDGTT